MLYHAVISEILTVVNLVQSWNALDPRDFTVAGIVTVAKFDEGFQGHQGIFTVEGMFVFLAPYRSSFDEVFIIQFFPSPSLYTVFPDATLIFAKFVHPSNTL